MISFEEWCRIISEWTPFWGCYEPLFSRLLWTPFWGCYEPLFRLLWTPFRDCYEPLLPSIKYTEPRLFINITIQNRSNEKNDWTTLTELIQSVWTPFGGCYEPLFGGCYEPLFGVAMNPFLGLLWTPFQGCYGYLFGLDQVRLAAFVHDDDYIASTRWKKDRLDECK